MGINRVRLISPPIHTDTPRRWNQSAKIETKVSVGTAALCPERLDLRRRPNPGINNKVRNGPDFPIRSVSSRRTAEAAASKSLEVPINPIWVLKRKTSMEVGCPAMVWLKINPPAPTPATSAPSKVTVSTRVVASEARLGDCEEGRGFGAVARRLSHGIRTRRQKNGPPTRTV